MSLTSEQENTSAGRRISAAVVIAILCTTGWGCPGSTGDILQDDLAAIFNTIAYIFIGGSDLPGESGTRCDPYGLNCLSLNLWQLEPYTGGASIPRLSDPLAWTQEDPQQNIGGVQVIAVGESAAEIHDVQAGARLATIDLTGFARKVAVSYDGQFAVVTVGGRQGEPSGADILDLGAMQQTGTTPLPADCNAQGVAFVPDSHDYFVGCQDSGSLHRFSANAGAGGPQMEEIPDCESPRDLAFTADGDRGLFTCTDSVWVYDVAGQEVIWKIPGFTDLRGLTARTDGTRAYVTDRVPDGGFRLVVLDLATYDQTNETNLEGFPQSLFLGARDSMVYAMTGSVLHIADADGNLESSPPTPLFALSGFAVDLPMP